MMASAERLAVWSQGTLQLAKMRGWGALAARQPLGRPLFRGGDIVNHVLIATAGCGRVVGGGAASRGSGVRSRNQVPASSQYRTGTQGLCMRRRCVCVCV